MEKIKRKIALMHENRREKNIKYILFDEQKTVFFFIQIECCNNNKH